MNIMQKIEKLKREHSLGKIENELFKNIIFWARDILKNSFIESNLNLIESYVNVYRLNKNSSQYLTASLMEIINGEYQKIK